MKPLLILMVGLPRSGKSTLCRKLLGRIPGAAIVNPDSFRLEIHGQDFIASREEEVWRHVDIAVGSLFRAGHPVVFMDATNMNVRNRNHWKDDRWERAYVSMMHVSAGDCAIRAYNDGREYLVNQGVIERMRKNYSTPANDLAGRELIPYPDANNPEGLYAISQPIGPFAVQPPSVLGELPQPNRSAPERRRNMEKS